MTLSKPIESVKIQDRNDETMAHGLYREVRLLYTNYKGETAVRRILPKKIWFGRTKYHPERQWLLDAYDVGKSADRTFAMKDIRAWFLEKG
jgi:predicted DNA-binding transcriptional regulator YafY